MVRGRDGDYRYVQLVVKGEMETTDIYCYWLGGEMETTELYS